MALKFSIRLFVPLLACTCLIIGGCAAQRSTFPYSSKEPMPVPVLFAPDLISTKQAEEWSFSFTPDGTAIYFQRGDYEQYTIYESHFENKQWSTPQKSKLAPEILSQDGDTFITRDGSKIFFASNRSTSGTKQDNDLWMATRSGDYWGEPSSLGAPVNSSFQEWLPSVASSGNLYFQSNRPGGSGQIDLYVSNWKDGKYTEPESLGSGINTSENDESPYIAPDESYLIFARGGSTLYISLRQGDEWGTPQPIKLPGDTGTIKYSPNVSPDSKYLFYTSNKAGTADIYQIDFNIDDYK
ncbi:hypothetical protein GON22_13650 [Paenibacillus sp. MMS18-CY102]|nr:hypothetical protein [Paenibacillus sp. MMS18-CY102]